MRLLVTTIILLLFLTTTAQQRHKTRTIFLNNWELANTYTLEVTQFVPLGNLNNSLGPSMGIGAYMGFPVNDRLRIDIGFAAYFPHEEQPIAYNTGDEIVEGGTNLSGAMGFWATKVKRIGRKLYWDNRIGTGLGFFQTDIETGLPERENNNVYGAETIFINLGTALRTSIFNQNIGLKLDYFLAPYNLFKTTLPRDFGMQYATLGITYGFR